MKKLFALTLSVLMILGVFCGCKPQKTHGASSQFVGKYLSTDPSKNSSYNEAIIAYDSFLSEKINAIDIETNKSTPLSDYFSDFGSGKSGISGYALYDITGDGVPELHIGSYLHYVFAYQDNQIKYIYCSPSSAMGGPIKILENGAIFTKRVSTGTFYYYDIFTSSLSKKSVYFYYCEHSDGITTYVFENKNVSKNEWKKLTEEYFNIPEANVDWHQWNNE